MASIFENFEILTSFDGLLVAHAVGMPGTFSPTPRVSDPDIHHGTCVTHVPRCMSGSLIGGFLGSRWRGKRSWYSRRMRNPQLYVSGKRPMRFQPDIFLTLFTLLHWHGAIVGYLVALILYTKLILRPSLYKYSERYCGAQTMYSIFCFA